MRTTSNHCGFLLAAATLLVGAQKATVPSGSFEGSTDVGAVLHPGLVEYDASKQTYTVSGSGENMWATEDAFQFVWKKVSGNVTLAADISFANSGGNAHKKAVLMIRQSLDADSVYVDAALHGNGLTSLQFREEKGDTTHEIQANVTMPRRLSISKQGEYFYMRVSGGGEPLHFAGGSARIPMKEPFYIGMGVCAHDKDAIEKAAFSNVELGAPAKSGQRPILYSTLETVTVASTDRRVVYVVPNHIEAPNWTHDGLALIFNTGGRLYHVPVAGGQAQIVDTGDTIRCGSAHGFSPDGSALAVSDEFGSAIYVVAAGGGEPRRITQKSPSYWHGWSPDGNVLVFSGRRKRRLDIYTIPATGGDETRLTSAGRFNDNPEYSPDGQYIYFNSDRTGAMQIWRMRPDGTAQEQVTADNLPNWFPHLSPDGQQMVFLSYAKDVAIRPEGVDVTLRIMSLPDGKIRMLARLTGGPGTIYAPCWSPDSRRVAFVSYQRAE